MTYVFKPGERVTAVTLAEAKRAGGPGHVIKTDDNGVPTADGQRTARVRIKLDHWPRPLWFHVNLVNPV